MVIQSNAGTGLLTSHSTASFLGSVHAGNQDWSSFWRTESAAQDVSAAVYFAIAAASAASGVLVVAHASGSVSFLRLCGTTVPKEEACEGRE
mmetsp:Transcript_30587/g.67441  ORF Transcript_30587/g.67441 Transcript_30587/m.67441 type:complete len:92 (-) Transcript_30587:725-1000(-)